MTVPPKRPVLLTIAAAIAGFSAGVWTLGLVAALLFSDVPLTLRIGAGDLGLFSPSGFGFVVLYVATILLAVGLLRDRWWSQPLLPFVFVVVGMLRLTAGGFVFTQEVVAALTAATIAGLYVYRWRAPRTYYTAIAEEQIVGSSAVAANTR